MITITEKTADAICKELREFIKTADEDMKTETETFEELCKKHSEREKSENVLDDIEEYLFQKATKAHEQNVEHHKNFVNQYTGFIEALMIGETE